MKILRLPKTIRWVLGCAFLLLVMMNLYRLGIHLYFHAGKPEGMSLLRTFWMGFRFDCRYAGGISLLVLLIGFLPGMHIFKRGTGKAAAMFIYSFFTLGLILLSAADFASLLTFRTRLDATLLTDLVKQTSRGKLLVKSIPWVTILIASGVITWIFFMIIRYMHYVISRTKSTLDRGIRIYWQTLTILLFVLCMYGRIGYTPLSPDIARHLDTPYEQLLSLNPVESLLGSIKSARPNNGFAPLPNLADSTETKH
jgi:hypothetical protein